MWSFFARDPVKGFQFEIGDKVEGYDSDYSIWQLHDGKQKSNGQPVSIFMFNAESSSEALKQTAQASAKRLKTLRHPNVLSFIDSLETDKCIYVVTEPVKPLQVHLAQNEGSHDLETSWGLHQIVKGLSFLLSSVNLVHNNVCMSSMFVDAAGEWKLGGVDYMFPASGEGSNIPPLKPLPKLEKYDPPEKTNNSRIKKNVKWASDMWGLGCLIWEVFNGQLPRTSSLKITSKIPKKLVRNYCELVSANPASRPSPDKFLENCKQSDHFMANHYVQANLFLEEIQIKEAHEQQTFFNDLTNHLDEFPAAYSKYKILPQLLNVFQYGNAGPSVLPPLFKLGKLLGTEEYQQQIVPCVVKLFSSTDRATRIHLLRQLPLFVEHLQPQVVNSQVFPNMLTGFMDTNPAIREQTVKGMLLLAPKLNENNLNMELMKHFARLQSRDEQGPIRTNTTVCLGKITQHLNPATRQKVITSAFARAMKDPFPAARTAGVLAMANNSKYFSLQDCACKALPVLCSLTIDPDKQVRDHVFKSVQTFLDRLHEASDNPEKAAKMNEEAQQMTSTSPAPGAKWTGWMATGVMTSLTSKLYTGVGANKPTDQSQPATSPSPVTSSTSTDVAEEKTKPPPATANPATAPPRPNTASNGREVGREDTPDGADEQHGWDDEDDEWDSLEQPAVMSRKENKPQEEGGAWEEWGEEEAKEDEGRGWGGEEWEQDGWGDESTNRENETTNSVETPASSYNWGNPSQDEFFSDFTSSAKPKKNILQTQRNKSAAKTRPTTSPTNNVTSSTKNLTGSAKTVTSSTKTETASSKTASPRTTPVTSSERAVTSSKKVTSSASDDWGSTDWGDDGDDWGDDSGLSKQEKMRREREEKRKLRQKQIEEKRAQKSKLGARKCD